MAKFNDELIENLKRETDIVRLIEGYGTKLTARDDGSRGEMIGLCPVHNDTSPSLVVNRVKNVWNCLGACGKGGDVIAWVMHAEKVGFRHAVDLLKEGVAGLHGRGRGGATAKNSRVLAVPVEATAEDKALLLQVAEYYHSRLKESPKALAYLEKRGIASAEAIDRFKIGFSDRSLGRRLPITSTKAGKAIRDRLKSVGVINQKTGGEIMRGCVTFPVLLADGGVGEIYGRRIEDHPTSKSPLHWYLSGPHAGVWNLSALQASDEIILCESIIDALTFWNHGYRNVTASFGAKGFTDDIHKALIANNVKRILIAYDNDEAGNLNADALAAKLFKDNFELFRLTVTQMAKDINGYAKTANRGNIPHDNARNWLGVLIRNATWLGKGKKPELTTPMPEIFDPNSALSQSLAKAAAAATAAKTKEKPEPVMPSTDDTPKAASKPAAKKEKPAVVEAPTEPKPLPSLAAETVAEATATASPVPEAPKTVEATVGEKEITIEIGNRSYRVRGLDKNLAFDVLKVNVLVRRDDLFYVDTLDLYAARVRAVFIKEASRELGFEPDVIKRDLGKVLLKLEELQDQQIEETLAVKEEKIELSDQDKKAAFELLKQPNLIERILSDFEACGVVGEETNKLVGYLAATSRKLPSPLAVLIQSSSAAGKSSLMEAVLAFMPHEDVIKYSAMTGQSLFYMGGMNLKHRILSIAEEEGVEQAAYALKLLQSEGELTIASTGKDPGTGRMETQEYHVEGPVMIFLTTTSDQTDPELKNRCVTLGVCEHACHTEAIHHQQRTRRTLGGQQLQHQRKAIRKLHQNAQRLLRPLTVVNNFAQQLTFRSDKTKSRRAHDHYLTLIEAVTLLHQYQRKEGTFVNEAGETCTYVEATLEDIELANQLADQFLQRSFDELPERTQVLLEQLIEGLQNLCDFQQIELWEQRFSRKDVRRWSTFGDTQLKEHLARLVDYEYLKIEAGGGKGRTIEYTLSYDPSSDQTTCVKSGLIDVEQLRSPDNRASKSRVVGQKNEEVAPIKNDSKRQKPTPNGGSRENDENGQADAA